MWQTKKQQQLLPLCISIKWTTYIQIYNNYWNLKQCK
jgi:hypothetical protein